MKALEKVAAEAQRFRARRSALAAQIAQVDTRYQEQLHQAEDALARTLKNLEDERSAANQSSDTRAKRDIESYSRKKAQLQSCVDPILNLCPRDARRNYLPNPARANEASVNQLIARIQEQGFLAWLKRLLRVGGYSSRQEMAMSVYRQIADACAFCDEQIAAAEDARERARQNQTTVTRRKIQEANDQHLQKKAALARMRQQDRQTAVAALQAFDSSTELNGLRARIARMQAEASAVCGDWGEYRIPDKMPEKVFFCDVSTKLPDPNGIDRDVVLPLWLDLFSSNIIVLTADVGAAVGNEHKAKLLVRKFLARMLKTVPPEWVSYTVFDSLRKGGSLERLIDVTNAGTTDLSFDVFTSEERGGSGVSCSDRRAFLLHRISDVVRSIAGKCGSLFEYNRNDPNFEYPLSWIVDFNFPGKPDARLMKELRDLLVNASAAGYSFLFVTTPEGYQCIDALAKAHTKIPVLHLDCDRLICSQGSFSAPLVNKSSPSSDQIGNFTTALNAFYENGSTVDNRIATVFQSAYGSRGIPRRDATGKVSIPMAIDSRGRIMDLELGGASGVHGFISGGTGSGKSTLLHTIILSACLHYHPDDLNIWLVDYKQTEFHLYRRKTPPHIKLIGVSKTDDFTFSLIDKIREEGDRRTRLMNLFNATSLAAYRSHAGEPGYESIPRLLILIDEFHEMSQFVAGVSEYKDKLENVLREYRAQGINFLMADQTFSAGLAGLSPAAKGQISVRIAMRNDVAPNEIRDTLEVDRALYSDSMQKTIALMGLGDFIMRTYVRNKQGDLVDIRLEKFKALLSLEKDVTGIGTALRRAYSGQFDPQELIYVNTTEPASWSDSEPEALDRMVPLRYPNIRLYLGRSATLQPCFAVDMGRQPNENMSILGGTVLQRWEVLHAVMESCRFRGYRLLVFMAEFSDMMSDHGREIREACRAIPGAELLETTEQWCAGLEQLHEAVKARQSQREDTVCVFIGLETAAEFFGRLPEKSGATAGPMVGNPFQMAAGMFGPPVGGTGVMPPVPQPTAPGEFNAMPMIDTLFSEGSRYGIRCVAEISVYRQFSKLLRLRDMCRHRIAFQMDSDDCLQYLGSSRAQAIIGEFAIYGNGGRTYKKLLPYKIEKER